MYKMQKLTVNGSEFFRLEGVNYKRVNGILKPVNITREIYDNK